MRCVVFNHAQCYSELKCYSEFSYFLWIQAFKYYQALEKQYYVKFVKGPNLVHLNMMKKRYRESEIKILKNSM